MQVRKIASLTLAAAGLLALTGCGLVPPNSTTNVAQDVATVQADAQQICAFNPTADTIASILSKNDPALATDEAIATAICNAINAAPAVSAHRLRVAQVYVDGVLVKGNFTK